MDLDHPLLLLPLGSLLTLVVQALTRRWSRQDDREKRDHGEAAARRAEVDRRADGAAEAAVDELERYADLYAGNYDHAHWPDPATTQEHLRKLQRHALLIRGPARMTLEEVVRLLRYGRYVEDFDGDYPYQIVHALCSWGRATLGAVLRSEPLPDEPPSIQRYREAFLTWEQLEDEEARARLSGC